jgi:hypothetical protein
LVLSRAAAARVPAALTAGPAGDAPVEEQPALSGDAKDGKTGAPSGAQK